MTNTLEDYVLNDGTERTLCKSCAEVFEGERGIGWTRLHSLHPDLNHQAGTMRPTCDRCGCEDEGRAR